ncbi:MAG: aldo/keto reductase [Rhizobiaceae bacterium]
MKTRHWDRIGNGGVTFTELGMGTAPLGNLYKAVNDEDAHDVLTMAWDAGIRYYDTAPLYGFGLSETRLNRFLRGKPRGEYVLSTKVGRLLEATTEENRDGIGKWFDVPNRKQIYDYSYDGIMRSLEFSLERLGVDRIDILYVHDIDLANHGTQDNLDSKYNELMDSGHKALVELRDQGVIKAFGVGVNEWQPCQYLAERGDFDLFLLAGRYTLLEQMALDTFLPLCEQQGLGVIIGGAYNSGILATGPVPGAWFDYELAPKSILERVGQIQSICEQNSSRMVDAAFQFPLLHPSVVSVIPGGQGVSEMTSNIQAAKTEIPPALWAQLKSNGLMHSDAPID